MTDPAPTWGISGPLFLALFAVAAVALWLLAMGLRRLAMAGRTPVRELHPYELAYLDGGRARVVAASLAALRLVGAVDARRNGSLRVTGSPGPASTPLDQAVLQAIAVGAWSKDLVSHHLVRPHLNRLHDSLVAEGLLNGAREKKRIRLAVLPLVLLLALGALRVAAGLQNDRPVGFLLLLMACVAGAALLLLGVPEHTGAAKRMLREARDRYGALRPSSSPDWRSYGPEAAALSVAVFGVTALTVMDPDFASAAEVQRQFGQAASSGSSSGGFSSSDSGSSDSGSSDGGSSCGGGGCGG
ncbi:TIGR04222 domain-containing membrane protein [Actinocorallia sp. B10E7]|uniref:TIGR04222 domain-containing membrane protein n=1 Tax=Actinocorallia sp. B10E7 TaxID=3153558 RepID=UPI00325C979F